MELGTTETIVIARNLGRCGTAVMLDPYIQSRLYTTEGAHIVTSTMNMQNRYGAHVSIGCSTTHGIAADRTEGCNEVGNLVHGMVREHAAHRKTTEIDAVAVYLMLGHHLVDNGLDEIDVTVAGSVPRFVYTIWEYHDELGSVTHCFHAHIVVLELVVLHPVGILVVAVTENKQRAVLAEVLRCIDIVRTTGAVNGDVVGFHRNHSCHQQEEE